MRFARPGPVTFSLFTPHSSLFTIHCYLLLYFPHPGFPFRRDRETYPLSVKRRRVFLFAAKKEPKNRRRFRRGGRTTKGPAGPLETLRLAPGDPVRSGPGNARLAVQAHAPETPVFRPPIENGEQRFPIPLRGRLPQASIRPELPEAGKGLSMLPFMCGHIQCRHAFRCFSFFAQWLPCPPLGLPEFCTSAALCADENRTEKNKGKQ